MCAIVIKSAYNLAIKILWYPVRQATLWISGGPLKTLILAMIDMLTLIRGF